jgi:hypothetical protein
MRLVRGVGQFINENKFRVYDPVGGRKIVCGCGSAVM